ncbi:hypothetical protein [Leeuwenhoekiella marinoflava]|uniref:hypothetical protein n=1 Tax=Leeuwenhoekiella marinoflava TaxID=988 RepID=UPI000FFE5B07|nr:hypothetical protein [Leeuwenhoekiella marinoflava]
MAQVFDARADYFMLLKARYDAQQAVETSPKRTPNLKYFRKTLFGIPNWIKSIGIPISEPL